MFLGLAASAAWSQEPPPQPLPATQETPAPVAPSPSADLTLEVLQTRRAEIEAATDLDEETKKSVLGLLDQAIDAFKKGEDWAARTASYEKGIAEAPSFLEELKKELASPPVEEKPDVPEWASLDVVQQKRAAAEEELRAAQDELDKLRKEEQTRIARRLDLPKDMARAKTDLDAVTGELAALRAQPAATKAAEGRLLFVRARQRALEKELEAYGKELEYYDRRRDLLAGRIERWQRRVNVKTKLVAAWREIETRAREEDAARAAAEAARATAKATQLHPVLEPIASRNQGFADELKGLTSKRVELEKRKAEVDDRARQTQLRFDAVKIRVESVGLTEAVGSLLRQEKTRLPDVRNLRRGFRKREDDLDKAQARIFELRLEQTDLSVDEAVATAMKGVDAATPEAERARIEGEARKLLERRKSPDGEMSNLIREYEAYVVSLVEVDTSERMLLELSDEFRDYIDERVLWIRSTSPMRIFAPARAAAAVQWLLDPRNWADIGSRIVRNTKDRPAGTGFVLLLIALIVLLRGRIRKMQVAISESDAMKTSFLPSVQVLLLVLLESLAIPVLFLLFSWRLFEIAEGSEFARGIAGGLRAAAMLFFPVDFLRRVCRPEGLADAHFRWSSRGLRTLRRDLVILASIVVPSMAVVRVFANQNVDPRWAESSSGIAFLVGAAALTVFAFRVFRPSGAVLEDTLNRKNFQRLKNTRFLWFPLTVAFPAALVGMTAAGYYYTAGVLALRIMAMTWLGVILLLVYALLLRYFLLARRRLAIKQARKRREEALARAREKGEASIPEIPVEAVPEIDFQTINLQTRRLLQTFVFTALILGVWLTWRDVMPALSYLDRITLSVGASGTEVTLGDLLMSLVIFVVTLIAARNIPGVLEVTILQGLPFQAGARYAITTISRYIIAIVGISIGFGSIGIGWGKVQWLVAALSVGIGFGLQEIVANFISGIILLLEQPIRVGDIVTIGTTSGRVTRIQMRATTIVDWDRRELVIPNKNFITGELINWTLSDTTSRIILPVGVAYGSDTQKVREILLEVGKASSYALDDPPPHVLFKGFGESSLDFELRVFVSNRENYVPILNEINTRIDERFRAAGIEIPFPQRDLHLRSIAPEISPVRLDAGAGGGAKA